MQPKDSTGLEPVRIPLYGRDGSIRAYTLVDASDAATADAARWALHPYGYAYRRSRVGGRRVVIMLHRVLLGLPPKRDGRESDHVNRDGLDNRRANLRIVTHAGNMQNRPSHRGSTSKYRGVYWHARDRRWIARVTVHGRQIPLGRFSDEEAAGEASRLARLELMPFATD